MQASHLPRALDVVEGVFSPAESGICDAELLQYTSSVKTSLSEVFLNGHSFKPLEIRPRRNAT